MKRKRDSEDSYSSYNRFAVSAVSKNYLEYSLLKYLGPVNDRCVLDLGCGSGHYSRLMHEMGAEEVVGVDILNETMQQPPTVGIQYVELANASVLGNFQFDVAISVLGLSYLTDSSQLDGLLRLAYHQLIPGGRLVIIASVLSPQAQISSKGLKKYGFNIACDGDFRNSLLGKFEFLGSQKADGAPVNHLFFTRQTYELNLMKAGFFQFQWHAMEVSPDSPQHCVGEFWRDLLESQLFFVLTCTKITYNLPHFP